MKIQPECVPCLLKRIIFEADQTSTDEKKRTQAIQNACKLLSETYNPKKSSAEIATKIHKIVYQTLEDKDPYHLLKQQSNQIAVSLLPKVEALIHNSQHPLKTSMICSIIGNIMDFGIAGSGKNPEALKEDFDRLYQEGVGYDEYPKLENILRKTRKIVFFTDNCGEIVFDKLLCRELKKFDSSFFISLVVKGEPIISDATLEDIQSIHFEEVVDEIMTTGCFAIGVDFVRLPHEVRSVLEAADLILCKGMANFEAFSETMYRPVAYLLRSKCGPIARSLGVPRDMNVIKVFE
ncbi:MAG: ARMT1-like domain-containing protein [Methanobacteriota archaeon]